MFKNDFHKNINALFDRAKDNNYKTTLEQYAQKLGTTKASLRGWLSGKGEPSTEGLKKISQVENISIDFLLGIVESKDKKTFNQIEQEIFEKINLLTAAEQKDVLAFVNGVLVQKKYTPNKQVSNKEIS